jgi:acetyl coenzyme A synthetase (ADP forming)-like protein
VAVPDLSSLLRPRSVAVIGASNRPGTIGGELFLNLLRNRFQGPVYPVNPKGKAVMSVRSWPSVAELPEAVDLAVVMVPAAGVERVVRACAQRGVRAVVVISAGFREIGAAGAEVEERLLEVARAHGMRLVGPNCLGVISTAPETRLDATFAPTYPPEGTVAVASQSGALGVAMLDYAAELGVGVSEFVSLGNKADLGAEDLLAWWGADERTRVILLYLESFGDARKFAAVAAEVNRRKPIVAVKSGRSRRGLQATSSHTGSLAGSDRAVEALVRATGIIRVDTVEELFDMAAFLAHQPVPTGRRVAILTNAGGPGILATDACGHWGLEVEDLRPETMQALREFLPAEASVRNPVDMIASATPEGFERATRILLEDPGVDALIALFVPPIVTDPVAVGQAIVRGMEAARAGASGDVGRADGTEGGDGAEELLRGKPVVSCFMGRHGVPEALRSLQAGQVPSYAFPETAVRALARAADYHAALQRPTGVHAELGAAPRAAVRQALDPLLARLGGGSDTGGAGSEGGAGEERRAAEERAATSELLWLNPAECETVLGAYEIPLAPMRSVVGLAAAEEAAAEVGYPVVLKVVAKAISHKSDVGGVQVNLGDEAALRAGYARIEEGLRAVGRSQEMEGVLVQKLVRGGVEVIVGAYRDPLFGPLVMFGSGGVTVELLEDVAFRLAPLTDAQARDLIESVRGAALLHGYRGSPVTDVAALESLLVRVSRLICEVPAIADLDLNPVKVLPLGQGCVAVDARIGLAAGPAAEKGRREPAGAGEDASEKRPGAESERRGGQ